MSKGKAYLLNAPSRPGMQPDDFVYVMVSRDRRGCGFHGAWTSCERARVHWATRYAGMADPPAAQIAEIFKQPLDGEPVTAPTWRWTVVAGWFLAPPEIDEDAWPPDDTSEEVPC